MSEIEKRRGFHYGFLIVACCCVFSATSVSLAFGCAGVFYTPVSEAIGVSRGVFVISFTCMSLTAGIGVKIMTPFVEKYSLKLAVIILLLLQSVCYFAQSQFTQVWMFYITGALLGIVVSLTQSIVATVAINRWFKTSTAFFIGFSSSMAGVSGVIINPIAGKVMETYGWRAGYIMYGAIILILAVPFAVFVFKDFPADKGLEPYSGRNKNNENKKDENIKQSDISIEYKDAVRSKAFFAAMGTISCFVCTCCFVPYVASYASSLGMSLTFAANTCGNGSDWIAHRQKYHRPCRGQRSNLSGDTGTACAAFRAFNPSHLGRPLSTAFSNRNNTCGIDICGIYSRQPPCRHRSVRNEKLYENLRLYMRIYVSCRCSDQPSYGNGC